MKWKLVPEDPTEAQVHAAEDIPAPRPFCAVYRAMLGAAPQPDHERMTREEAQEIQTWKGMDGAIAFHLIERHAEGWNQVGMMMEAWLDANSVQQKEFSLTTTQGHAAGLAPLTPNT
jgi:hypothetical protein